MAALVQLKTFVRTGVSAFSAAILLQSGVCAAPVPHWKAKVGKAASVSPTLQLDGIAAKRFTWLGHVWNNDSGQAWSSRVPYAIRFTSDGHIRFELRDSPDDRGQIDPPHKRRAEISSIGDRFRNHVPYWMAYGFKTHWDCVACQVNTGDGHESMQIHWPSRGSPALAFRMAPYDGSAGFKITTRGDGERNVDRYAGPISLDQCHDVVFHFELGARGFEEVWLDGKQVSNLHDIPVGTDAEDGYAMRLGPYTGEMAGNRIISDYSNIAPFPSTADLSARIRRPPPC